MLEDFKSWLGLVSTALSVGALVYTWLTARSSANTKALDEHTRKLTEHDRRIQAVEAEQKHAPSKDDVHALQLAISDLTGTVRAQNVQLQSVSQTVGNIDRYLRKGDET